MGAWGIENFANDSALDWAASCKESSRREPFLLKSLAETKENGEEALAAAEMVAALLGHPANDLPEELADLALRQKKEPSAKLVQAAKASVASVLENSELKQLWAEAEQLDEWEKIQAGLLERLGRPYLAPTAAPKKRSDKPPRSPIPARIHLVKEDFPGFSVIKPFEFRISGVPELSSYTGIQLYLTSDFTPAEIERIAAHLKKFPQVQVELCDPLPQRGFKLDPKILTAFSSSQALVLSLDKLKSLDFLSEFRNLKKLFVQKTRKLQSLEIISSLSSLEVLAISLDEKGPPLPALDRLAALRYLIVHGTGAPFSAVQSLSGLERLNLILAAGSKAEDRSDLSGMRGLKYLSLSPRSTNPFAALKSLPALEHLSVLLPDPIDISELEALNGHPTLKTATFGGFPGWRELEDAACKLLGTRPAEPMGWPQYFSSIS